ncbi:RecQ family ATP-dependent DNA helicase [Azospirillum sp. TSA6c]|uniref:RecQ family ATP-dependent DNA helicase n=1 Tax=unclassified Azospirillum TaxID=2630922 RepID=UPI000D64266E|nr:RecQ family ATP-dependent DNA helicase [Azospirillum sp. TSA6c]
MSFSAIDAAFRNRPDSGITDADDALVGTLAGTLYVDVEADRAGRPHLVGAVLGDRAFRWEGQGKAALAGLKELDAFARGARCIAGHNILAHDLPILRDAVPGLSALMLPVIDTLLLSPLAHPANPYHRLVKDYKLVKETLNDPVADARLCRTLLHDSAKAFLRLALVQPDVAGFHRFAFSQPEHAGMADLLGRLGAPLPPSPAAAMVAWRRCAGDAVCTAAAGRLSPNRIEAPEARLPFAYALAWLTVAGGSSVLPAWVWRRHPDTARLLAQLRDTPCGDDACPWCRVGFDAVGWLARTFGFDSYRAEPAAPDGGSLQQRIVEAGLAGRPHLAVLATGGGKSLCFQVPALARHHRTGALTVVISPLQALMKDQVDNLEAKTKHPVAAALYGALTQPERLAVMERVRCGDVAILYVSPEQLRNPSVTRTIEARQIGAWVFDEAHCLSKWGHDFRPDYLYTARFIADLAKRQGTKPPPVCCFTATAKHEVVDEIRALFRDRLGQDLTPFAAGVDRANLTFAIEAVDSDGKVERIDELLAEHLPAHDPGACAVVYAATRRRTEELRDALTGRGWQAAAFHAGMKVPAKQEVQAGFVDGSIKVVCATNAFGMGIDKDTVRLVVHADVPGSLEAYLQEAGRAGRDRQPATCVLLYDPADLETQFRLSAASELTRRDVAQVLRGVRKLARTLGRDEVVTTTGELMADPDLRFGFDAEDMDADTKVKTALSWLERAGLVERNENRTWVVTARPRLSSTEEARRRITALDLPEAGVVRWMSIYRALLAHAVDPDDETLLTVDFLARLPALEPDAPAPPQETTGRVLAILGAMATHGLIESGPVLTALVRPAGINASRRVSGQLSAIGRDLIDLMREEAPDGEPFVLTLNACTQRLRDHGRAEAQPEVALRLLKSLGDLDRNARLRLTPLARGRYRVRPSGPWDALAEGFRRRTAVAGVVLDRLLAKVRQADAGGKNVVGFTLEEMAEAVRGDVLLAADLRDPFAEAEAALLLLHDWKAIVLQSGLSVFRQGLSLRLPVDARGRRYTKDDHAPLARHYQGRTFQIHAMGEFATLGLTAPSRALAFAADYFSLPEDRLVERHFRNRRTELGRPVTGDLYDRIVTSLGNPAQQAIVTAGVGRNLLVLAGPGSGKTRVIVHRCAWLMRVQRVPAQAILVVCFNHSAALSVRRRLRALIGDEAAWVDARTYHALAMRLVGATFAGRVEGAADGAAARTAFDDVIRDATALLRGERAFPGLDAEDVRERLLARYRYILIDEYQDIDEDQYNLVSAIAGRQEKDPEARIALMAVGDDDQAVYGFRGADVAFIRRFRDDYNADVHHLLENYRSSKAIVEAAATVVASNRGRMKEGQPLSVDKARARHLPGGRWHALDPVGRGRVRVLSVEGAAHQVGAALAEIRRLRALDPGANWADFAVLAHNRAELVPFQALCERNGVPADPAFEENEKAFPLHRLREVVAMLDRLRDRSSRVDGAWLRAQAEATRGALGPSPWWAVVDHLLGAWDREYGSVEVEPEAARETFYEALAQLRRERPPVDGLFLGTLHGAKGMEFRHVVVLDAGWNRSKADAHREEERRLFYVGMTRARETLCLMQRADVRHPHLPLLDGLDLDRATAEGDGRAEQLLLNRNRSVLGLGQLFIDFAGRRAPDHPLHRALSALRPGAPVRLEVVRDRQAHAQAIVRVCAGDGTVIAQLATDAAAITWGRLAPSVEQARVLAVVRRYRTDGKVEWRDKLRVDSWEIPIIEVWTAAAR